MADSMEYLRPSIDIGAFASLDRFSDVLLTPPESPSPLDKQKVVSFGAEDMVLFRASDQVAQLRQPIYHTTLRPLNWNSHDAGWLNNPGFLLGRDHPSHCCLQSLGMVLSEQLAFEIFCAPFISWKEHASGKVVLANLAYHKEVTIRYTVNGWKSYQDCKATFKQSLPTKLDMFEFTIRDLSNWPRDTGGQLELAIRLQMGGHTYWDNNAGQNYRFAIDRKALK